MVLDELLGGPRIHGLAMMGLEFALVARFRAVAAPFGQDALLQFHRQISYVGLIFSLTHFAISANRSELTLSNAVAAPLLVFVEADKASSRAGASVARCTRDRRAR